MVRNDLQRCLWAPSRYPLEMLSSLSNLVFRECAWTERRFYPGHHHHSHNSSTFTSSRTQWDHWTFRYAYDPLKNQSQQIIHVGSVDPPLSLIIPGAVAGLLLKPFSTTNILRFNDFLEKLCSCAVIRYCSMFILCHLWLISTIFHRENWSTTCVVTHCSIHRKK